ncbi:hypothetical protein SBA5_440011 [Candidatus Sulfotelmatomonas gaucii]|uniref:Uncharacterized protein n=1 Tax=Candidatus Sulfuritelmatomonas gaucii TaxID=2043161 RepID=A0A2N9LM46_9BACT|nr:hypothetical protein SBA5_440011 [Candidatus Sulfotelmatomonas gaucii]
MCHPFAKSGQRRHIIPEANQANAQTDLLQRSAEPFYLRAFTGTVDARETNDSYSSVVALRIHHYASVCPTSH